LTEFNGVNVYKKERGFTTPAFDCISCPKYKYELRNVASYTYVGSQARRPGVAATFLPKTTVKWLQSSLPCRKSIVRCRLRLR